MNLFWAIGSYIRRRGTELGIWVYNLMVIGITWRIYGALVGNDFACICQEYRDFNNLQRKLNVGD